MLMPSLFNDNFDLFNDFYRDPWMDGRDFRNLEKKLYGHRAKNVMNTDVKETEDEYKMIVDLPGFKKDEITVQLDNGYLTINAGKSYRDDEEKDGRYIRRERYTGQCARSYYVGEALTEEDIKANFKHGILTLEIPKRTERNIEQKKYVTIEG